MNIITQAILYISSAIVISLLFLILYKRKDRAQIILFLRQTSIYLLPLVLLIGAFSIGLKSMSRKMSGITMSNQLTVSFENVLKKPYHTIIMGNSRTYRGINPDMMDSLTYNFSFDNETFFEQYFKLTYLGRNGHMPKLLILGVDYFEFSFLSQAMRVEYNLYFDSTYDSLLNALSQRVGTEFAPIDNVDDWVNNKMSSVFGQGASRYLSHLWRQLNGEPFLAPYLKDNGQYIIQPVPKASQGEFMTRSSKVESYQKDKFEQILALMRVNGVKVLLLMPPCRDIELDCYTKEFKDSLDTYFNSFERPDSVWYINMSLSLNYTLDDYMDDTHLNPTAADKFSSQLNQTIRELVK